MRRGKRSDTRSDGEGRMEKKEEVKTASVLMGGKKAKSQGGRTHWDDDLFVPLRQQPWHKENASWGRIKQDESARSRHVQEILLLSFSNKMSQRKIRSAVTRKRPPWKE